MPSPLVYFEAVTFKNGSTLDLPASGVVVFVGPNNVGKTSALLELRNRILTGVLQHNGRNLVFEEARVRHPSEEDAQQWLQDHRDETYVAPTDRPEQVLYRNWSADVHVHEQVGLPRLLDLGRNNPFASLLVSEGTGAQFDGLTPDLYGTTDIGQSRQFEVLMSDDELISRLSDISVDFFGTPIGVNLAGSRAALHFGEIPKIRLPATEVELNRLLDVPLLSAQGKGVTTLMAQAISISLGNEPLVFLDEPEAHLHPPQAQRAGRFLADRANRSQVFVATHDLNFLLGILEGNVPTIIVRLDRITDEQSVHSISTARLSELWNDKPTRYAGVLSGLMHKGLVICEGDSDSRFFEVALDHYNKGNAPHDLRFVHSDGKGGLAKLSAAARSLAIPSSVVADFDLLRDWDTLRRLVESRGVLADPFRVDWDSVSSQLQNIQDDRTVADVLDELTASLKADSGLHFDRSARKKIDDLTKVHDGWEGTKKNGLSILRGSSLTAAKRLLDQLQAIGIFLIPTGELESLLPETTGGLHGPSWTSKVISDGTYQNLDDGAKQFVLALVNTTLSVQNEDPPDVADAGPELP